jgi:hypothetical protein
MSMFTWIVNLWWMLVFWWKKKTGWIDMGETIEVTGTVITMIPPDVDGDMTFNVKLDPGLEKYITGFGGRLTWQIDATEPSIHCEIEPWAENALHQRYKQMKIGDQVRVKGAWGFDGVHLGVPMWREIFAALIRHQPNVKSGWFEIHPVAELEITTADAVVDKTQ